MKLSELGGVVVPKQKITDYLLSTEHPDGASKARYFIKMGFTPAQWIELKSALVEMTDRFDVSESIQNEFGTKYIVDGELKSPTGKVALIRAVWIVETDSDSACLVTAYPLQE
jgi:hypothetical protein